MTNATAEPESVIDVQKKVKKFCSKKDIEEMALLYGLATETISLGEYRTKKRQLKDAIATAFLLFREFCKQVRQDWGECPLDCILFSKKAEEKLAKLTGFISSH